MVESKITPHSRDILCLWFDGLYSIYCLVDTDLSWVTFQAYKLFFCLFYKASKTIFLLVSTSFWQPLFHFFVFWPTLLVTFQAENFSFWQFSYFLFTGSRPPQQDIALVSGVHKFSTNLRCQNELFLFFPRQIRMSFFAFFLVQSEWACSLFFSRPIRMQFFSFFLSYNENELFLFFFSLFNQN